MKRESPDAVNGEESQITVTEPELPMKLFYSNQPEAGSLPSSTEAWKIIIAGSVPSTSRVRCLAGMNSRKNADGPSAKEIVKKAKPK
ncbi:uncharacterized protein CTRU02_213034 [Colletotrichum truncatum]|uniref:Uncharacterized protein n=1 Tax=Colletotrichum truncatum TaxID=5467 RepID=A0ACC3YJJ8_COLTU|nr:uncharacterized protein CTRU02_03354 [Colletotrichum truncatum]KAF6797323.1 hypothetical protein CTRU02_03354 [Colletotrichum truncatum]